MFLIDHILLIAGALLLLGIASSKLSTKIGMPGLVLFIVIGALIPAKPTFHRRKPSPTLTDHDLHPGGTAADRWAWCTL